MKRWLVALTGSMMDLEEFPRWFPDGDVYAIAEGDQVYLTGQAFEHFVSAKEVRDFALARLDEFYGCISLLWNGINKPSVGILYRENEAGNRLAHHVMAIQTASFRVKASATLSGGTGAEITQAQLLLSSAKTAKHLYNALLSWSDPIRTWPRLYRILEELEEYLKMPVSKAGFCSKNERTRFTATANTDAAGLDSRHAGGKFDAPDNPMALTEGIDFVGRMIEGVLRRAAPSQC
ncbi:hypothetical protein RY831_03280 [Noviherbaspirillum sp. CPCC 100848]|uniref:Uncharacterized protein n=1 Tax=Noviherbaspirillum album TaxID=3080276 RepID=A0ABU6J3P9_9BURK|nr:hypothetical protein [Noviherbaspirillum sp. CPCC 100848]MEC4718155.1 hypothetical protein [Noviherbaspirillum sp. CPCC 100848]